MHIHQNEREYNASLKQVVHSAGVILGNSFWNHQVPPCSQKRTVKNTILIDSKTSLMNTVNYRFLFHKSQFCLVMQFYPWITSTYQTTAKCCKTNNILSAKLQIAGPTVIVNQMKHTWCDCKHIKKYCVVLPRCFVLIHTKKWLGTLSRRTLRYCTF